jgi:hypothetical protein
MKLIINKDLEVLGILLQRGTLTNEMVQLSLLREIPIIRIGKQG